MSDMSFQASVWRIEGKLEEERRSVRRLNNCPLDIDGGGISFGVDDANGQSRKNQHVLQMQNGQMSLINGLWGWRKKKCPE